MAYHKLPLGETERRRRQELDGFGWQQDVETEDLQCACNIHMKKDHPRTLIALVIEYGKMQLNYNMAARDRDQKGGQQENREANEQESGKQNEERSKERRDIGSNGSNGSDREVSRPTRLRE